MIFRFSKRPDVLAVILIALLFGGCGGRAGFGNKDLSMPVLVSYGAFSGPTSGYGLPQVTLLLGTGRLVAEIASTPIQASVGLSFRDTLASDHAMLFTYPEPHKVVFHMKDTSIPLSVAFIDSMGTVLEVQNLVPGSTSPIHSASNAIRFVLEVNRGWFEKYGVIVGSRVSAEP